MSETVRINSEGWMLTTFYGGEQSGRCYELKFPTHNTSYVVTERDLLGFFLEKGEMVNPRPEPSRLPHSRACGITPHDHGTTCHTSCPTCGGGKPNVVPLQR